MLALLGLFCFLIPFYFIGPSQANAGTNMATEDLVALVRDLERRVGSLESQVKLLKEHKTSHAQDVRGLDTISINMMKGLDFARKQIGHEVQEMYARERQAESRINNLGDILKSVNLSTAADVTKKYCEAVSLCTNNFQVKRQQTNPNNGVIAFSTYLDHDVHNLGLNQPLKFNQILLNEGHGYNQNTGIFTVPVGGIYIFSWTVADREDGNLVAPDIWMKLVVNGEHKGTAVAESMRIRDDEMGTNILILRVQTGDAVWVTHHEQAHTQDIFSSDTLRLVTFSAALLYQ